MARRAAEEHLDLDAIRRIATTAPRLARAGPARRPTAPVVPAGGAPVRVGVFRDAAFQFYYSDNLEALKREGAELVSISPLTDASLPPVDALYIGGGFPESFAATLAENRSFREALRRAVEEDLPVYAECGGAVYLGRELQLEGVTYPMAGAIPAVFAFSEKPEGHGYVILETVAANPFYAVEETLRGHEFHYTHARAVIAENVSFAFRVLRGQGFGMGLDGLCYRNVLACYTHVHALGTESWAPGVVRAAQRHREERLTLGGPHGGEGAPVAAARDRP
jgi:cobyrinic acid a,c-diamide synthase